MTLESLRTSKLYVRKHSTSDSLSKVQGTQGEVILYLLLRPFLIPVHAGIIIKLSDDDYQDHLLLLAIHKKCLSGTVSSTIFGSGPEEKKK